MAATGERNYATGMTGERSSIMHDTIDASQTIYMGSIGVNLAGKVRKYVVNTAGQTMLGMAPATYKETTGAAVTYDVGDRMSFKRGPMTLKNSVANPVTNTQIGKLVQLEDEDTVSSAAIGGNDLSVRLLGFDGDGGAPICQVE